MSNFFKICLAFIASLTVVSSMYAQATIEEVVVTAQRTEQSLQDVPIAVSAFTDEMLSDRQIEVASDIQLQVPGVGYSSNTFGTGGFSIRGITNLATAASADAGVEVHLNGLPLGTTSEMSLALWTWLELRFTWSSRYAFRKKRNWWCNQLDNCKS